MDVKIKEQKQKGQLMIEMILIMFIFLGITLFIQKTFSSQQVLSKLIESPWSKLAGFMEAGVWASPKDARASHPQANPTAREGDTN